MKRYFLCVLMSGVVSFSACDRSGHVNDPDDTLSDLHDPTQDSLTHDLQDDLSPVPHPTGDTDGDGIPDLVEISSHYSYGPTDWLNPDSDGDGFCDGSNDVPPVCIAGEDLNNDGKTTSRCESDPSFYNDYNEPSYWNTNPLIDPATRPLDYNARQSVIAVLQHETETILVLNGSFRSLVAMNDIYKPYVIQDLTREVDKNLIFIDFFGQDAAMYMIKMPQPSTIEDLYDGFLFTLNVGLNQISNTGNISFINSDPVFLSDDPFYNRFMRVQGHQNISLPEPQSIFQLRQSIVLTLSPEAPVPSPPASSKSCQNIAHFFSIQRDPSSSARTYLISGALICQDDLSIHSETLLRNISDSSLTSLPIDFYENVYRLVESCLYFRNIDEFLSNNDVGYSVTSSIFIAANGQLIPQNGPTSGPYWTIDTTDWTLHIENIDSNTPIVARFWSWYPDTR